MDSFVKACHVFFRVNVHEKDDVDVKKCDNTNLKRVAHGWDTVEAQHSEHR